MIFLKIALFTDFSVLMAIIGQSRTLALYSLGQVFWSDHIRLSLCAIVWRYDTRFRLRDPLSLYSQTVNRHGVYRGLLGTGARAGFLSSSIKSPSPSLQDEFSPRVVTFGHFGSGQETQHPFHLDR